jgi:hypothetical protein
MRVASIRLAWKRFVPLRFAPSEVSTPEIYPIKAAVEEVHLGGVRPGEVWPIITVDLPLLILPRLIDEIYYLLHCAVVQGLDHLVWPRVKLLANFLSPSIPSLHPFIQLCEVFFVRHSLRLLRLATAAPSWKRWIAWSHQDAC